MNILTSTQLVAFRVNQLFLDWVGCTDLAAYVLPLVHMR